MVARARFAQCPRLALTTPRGSRSLGEKYHDNCGCTVAEVFDDWEPSYAERQQKALYEEARKACKEQGLEPNTKNVLAQMRELGDGTIHDAHVPESKRRKPGRKPKTATGGSGGGRKKPPRQIMGFGGRDERGDYPRPEGYRRSDDDPRLDAPLFDKIVNGIMGKHGKMVGGHGYGKTPVGKHNTEFPRHWGDDRIAAAFYETLEDGERNDDGVKVTVDHSVKGVVCHIAFNRMAQVVEESVEFYPLPGAGVVELTWKGNRRKERVL